MTMKQSIQLLFFAWLQVISYSKGTEYPHRMDPQEIIYTYRKGAYLSFTVNTTDCRILEQSIPMLKNYSFGEEIRHSRYILYGPLNNLTFWRQRFVDNRDVKRIGPVLRLTGIEMDATGYAYVYIDDFDPRTLKRLSFLHMLCGSYRGFVPYAQTPGGSLVDFDDIINQLSQGALLTYSLYPSWCEPRPKNYTRISIDVGPIDEYRFDSDGHLVFTYRNLNHDLSVDVTTIKMTSPTDMTMETYKYSQTDGKSSPLVTKTCQYGESHMFGVYRIPSPQGQN